MTSIELDFHGRREAFNISRQGAAFNVEHNGRSMECRVVSQTDAFFVLEVVEPGGVRRHIHAAGAANGDARRLWIDGRYHTYQRVRRIARETAHFGTLASTIPAVVTQLLVSVGDHVSSGDKLMLLESMKMIIPIQAPQDGVIKAIYCSEGESVQAGVQLIELEPEGNE
jgi:biotin carboxyl carrier protein